MRDSKRSAFLIWCFEFAPKSLRLEVGIRADNATCCLQCALPRFLDVVVLFRLTCGERDSMHSLRQRPIEADFS